MATVVSEGSLTRIESSYSGGWYSTPSSLDLYTVTQDYGSIYRTQPSVRQVLSFIARNIAQLGLHTFRRISDVERERLTGHGLARLLKMPDPEYRKVTAYRLMESMVQDRGIYGAAYWAKLTAPGDTEPTALLRLFPYRVIPHGTPSRVDYYRYIGSKGYVDIPADRVVTFRYYNPTDDTCGISPLETLRRTLAEDEAASDYRERFWKRGAKLSGIIERPPMQKDWSPAARQQFITDWTAANAGTGPNVGGTAVLEDGMTFKEMGSSFRDAQYLEAHKLTREEAAALYHVPPPMVGILDNANYSNTREFHKILYQDTLGPDLEMIQQEIEAQLLPDFADSEAVYVEFNVADKLKGSFEEQAAAYSLAVGGPYMARAEVRARENLPPFDDPEEQARAERLIVPMNVTVGGQAAPNAPQPGKSNEDTIRDFVGRLKRGVDAGKQFNHDRWTAELVADLNGGVSP